MLLFIYKRNGETFVYFLPCYNSWCTAVYITKSLKYLEVKTSYIGYLKTLDFGFELLCYWTDLSPLVTANQSEVNLTDHLYLTMEQFDPEPLEGPPSSQRHWRNTFWKNGVHRYREVTEMCRIDCHSLYVYKNKYELKYSTEYSDVCIRAIVGKTIQSWRRGEHPEGTKLKIYNSD